LNGEPMSADALEAIAEAQLDRKLFLSAITGWEAALALTKRDSRPDLGGRDGGTWFGPHDGFLARLWYPSGLPSPSKRHGCRPSMGEATLETASSSRPPG
jgi:hypothetical protein